jgi:hypothetical protein
MEKINFFCAISIRNRLRVRVILLFVLILIGMLLYSTNPAKVNVHLTMEFREIKKPIPSAYTKSLASALFIIF